MQLQIHHPTKVSSLILESTHRESNIQLKVEDSPGPNPTCGRWTPWLHRQHPEWTRPAGDSLISGTLLESLSLKSTSGKWPRKLKVVDIQRNLRVTIHCIQRSKNIGVKEDYKRQPQQADKEPEIPTEREGSFPRAISTSRLKIMVTMEVGALKAITCPPMKRHRRPLGNTIVN